MGGVQTPFSKKRMNISAGALSPHLNPFPSSDRLRNTVSVRGLFITAAGLDVYQFTGLQTSWNTNINPLIQAFVFGNGCCAILCRYDMIGLIALTIFETAFKRCLATQTDSPTSSSSHAASVGGPWCKLYFPLTSLALSLFFFFTANTKLFLIRCC